MHPAYRSDKPGIAPDCGMQFDPVYEDEDPALKLQLPLGAVYIDAEKQRLIGVRVEAVGKNTGSRLVRTTGRVEIGCIVSWRGAEECGDCIACAERFSRGIHLWSSPGGHYTLATFTCWRGHRTTFV